MESDVKMEPPLLDEAQIQEQISLETDPLLSETNYEGQGDEFDNMFGDEASNTELSEVEESMRAAFLNPDLAVEPQQEEEDQEEAAIMTNYVQDEELEPEMIEEPFENQYIRPDDATLEELQQLDMMEQQMLLSQNYPNEGARMEEAGAEFMAEEDGPVFDEQIEGAGRRFLPNPERLGRSSCTGVLFEGRCYQFFKEPKRFEEAEFFCQSQFMGGHLASITSPRIHRDVMDLMLTTIGTRTRAWVGGLRFLDTGRFVWLDGSLWDYSDWLVGEPNHTANKEECLEVLANGKFNDFTCWEPQPFFCSCPCD
uniref:Si:ch211-160b11.4 n=1 Tax=Acanthochromis polyacanthus TaxID=80966 RepID=A0A3Q1EPN8_9TELE